MKIALLIDVDNYKVNEKELSYLFNRLNMKGEVVYGKVYNFSDKANADLRDIIEQNGFDTAMQSSESRKTKKSQFDMRIALDATRLCFTNNTIDTFCLACGDGNIVPLISMLRAEGKRVLGCFNFGNEQNERVCNEVILINRLSLAQVKNITKNVQKKVQKIKQTEVVKPAKTVEPVKTVEPAKKVVSTVRSDNLFTPQSPERWERVERQLDEVEKNRPSWLDEDFSYEEPKKAKEPVKSTYEVERVKTTTKAVKEEVAPAAPVYDTVETVTEEEAEVPQHRFNAQTLAAKLESFARRTAALNFDSGEDIEEKRQLLAEIDECLNDEEFQGEKLTPDEEEAFNEIKSLVESLKETIQSSIE